MSAKNEKDKKKWTKDGRHWYFRCTYRDIHGKKRYFMSKMYPDRETAEAEELKFKTKKSNPSLVKFTVVADEYLDNLLKTRKESTAYTYRMDYKARIQPYFKNFYINSINIPVIKNWHEELEKSHLKLKYLNKLNGILMNIFDYAIKNYGLETNVARQYGAFERSNEEIVSDENRIRYISYEDFNEFISIIDNELWYTFFIFLYYTGMRKGEVQALSWKDIDFESNNIVVNKTLSIKTKGDYKITNTKNYINRKVKMSKTLREQLFLYKNHCMKYTDFSENWFVFGNSRFLPQTTIDRYKKKYFDMVNSERNDKIQEITIHEFRHSHVTLLVNEYIKKCERLHIKIDTTKFFLMLANRMGHSVETMMKIYLHLFDSVQDEVVDLLDNL